MPWPASTTLTSTWSVADSMKTSTRPPSGVNLIAFASRFQITCCSRSASPLTVREPGTSWNARSTFLVAAKGRTASSAPCATAARSTGLRANRTAPLRIRDVSNRSSIMCARAAALRPIAAIARSAPSGGNSVDSRIRAHPRTALKGVRISCATIARNLSLRWLAVSASSPSVCARTAATTRCSLASRIWDMRRSSSRSTCVALTPLRSLGVSPRGLFPKSGPGLLTFPARFREMAELLTICLSYSMGVNILRGATALPCAQLPGGFAAGAPRCVGTQRE